MKNDLVRKYEIRAVKLFDKMYYWERVNGAWTLRPMPAL
jgi:hypothetical protein